MTERRAGKSGIHSQLQTAKEGRRMLSIVDLSDNGRGYQATVAVGAAAAGTIGVITASAPAGVVAVSVIVPLVSFEVQSREMCPAVPHL